MKAGISNSGFATVAPTGGAESEFACALDWYGNRVTQRAFKLETAVVATPAEAAVATVAQERKDDRACISISNDAVRESTNNPSLFLLYGCVRN